MFANDVTIVSVSKHLSITVNIAENRVNIIRLWITSVGFNFGSLKKQAVPISSRKQKE